MKRNYTIIPLFLLLFVAMVACSNKSRNNADSEGKQPQSTVNVPQFDATALISMSRHRWISARAYPIRQRIEPAESIS